MVAAAVALLDNELQVINWVALGMHGLHTTSVPLVSFYSTKSVPVFSLPIAPAVGVSPVVLPAQGFASLSVLTYSPLNG